MTCTHSKASAAALVMTIYGASWLYQMSFTALPSPKWDHLMMMICFSDKLRQFHFETVWFAVANLFAQINCLLKIDCFRSTKSHVPQLCASHRRSVSSYPDCSVVECWDLKAQLYLNTRANSPSGMGCSARCSRLCSWAATFALYWPARACFARARTCRAACE